MIKRILITILVCVFILDQQTIFSQNRDSSVCLEVKGKILFTTRADVTIDLMVHNKVVESVLLHKGRKKFEFKMIAGEYYTIRVSSPETFDRLICFDTRQFTHTHFNPYQFSFETDLVLLDSDKILNQEAIGYPIAIVYYSKKTNKFEYNKAYTARYRKDICHK